MSKALTVLANKAIMSAFQKPLDLCDGRCRTLIMQLDRLREENETLLDETMRLKAELNLSDVVFYKGGLSPNEGKLLHALLNRPMISKGFYANVMTDDAASYEDPIKLLDVYICKIRSKLKEFKPLIETAWGNGYFIQPIEQKRLKTLLIEKGEAS